jgi:hypothetical protein
MRRRGPQNPNCYRAKPHGKYKGKRVYSYPVEVTFGAEAALSQAFEHYRRGVVWVIAYTAKGAADLVSDELMLIPCTELSVWGPQGGLAEHRYWGWDRAIYLGMIAARQKAEVREKQLELWRSRLGGGQ